MISQACQLCVMSVGINFNRVIRFIFTLGPALGALTGVMVGMYYRQISFTMGWSYGLKAFTATILLYLPAITRALHGELHAPASVFAIAGGGVLGPIVEEWLFRGLLWNHLREVAPGRRGLWLAIGVGSLIFGFWHMTFEGYTLVTLGNAVIHASFGVVVACARWRTEGILLGCVLHVAGNTLMILAS